MSHVATVTIDNTEVDADLTDFPVYIDLSDMPASFWDVVTNGGGDIRVFKDDDSTELAREVVSCLTASDTGELHVKFTGTLSSSTDTVIHIYADGTSTEPSASSTYGSEAVWSDYDVVLHLKSSGLNAVDNTTLDKNAVTFTDSKIGKGATQTNVAKSGFDNGTNSMLDSETISYSAWFKTSADFSQSNGSMLLCQYSMTSSPWYSAPFYILMGTTTSDRGKIRSQVRNVNGIQEAKGATQYNDGAWHHAVASYNGTTIKNIVDGSVDGTASASGTPGASRKQTIGGNWDEAAGNVYVGDYDEIRITGQFAISEDWATTEYNNQNSPSTFYTVTAVSSSTTSIKSLNGLAIASVKSRNGLAKASIKSINGLSNTS